MHFIRCIRTRYVGVFTEYYDGRVIIFRRESRVRYARAIISPDLRIGFAHRNIGMRATTFAADGVYNVYFLTPQVRNEKKKTNRNTRTANKIIITIITIFFFF